MEEEAIPAVVVHPATAAARHPAAEGVVRPAEEVVGID